MAVYLIDFENVGNEGLKGVETLEKEDAVHIFYNEAISRLTFPVAEKIFRCKAQIRFFPASVGGNNALDFQLSSWLGYLYGRNQEEVYNIISRDKGFLHAAEFWRGLKEVGEASIYCWPSIIVAQKRNTVDLNKKPELTEETKVEEITKEAQTESENTAQETEIEKPAKKEFVKAIKNINKITETLENIIHRLTSNKIDEKGRETVCELVKKSESKMDLYRTIVAAFGQKKGQEIYRCLKPEYNKIKKISNTIETESEIG